MIIKITTFYDNLIITTTKQTTTNKQIWWEEELTKITTNEWLIDDWLAEWLTD